ncbi:MAG: hypothetical protein HQ551_09765 [Desulfobacteraceae bacterium]|nr:hypothetical protein [Desulfobacteraceae bacterium]
MVVGDAGLILNLDSKFPDPFYADFFIVLVTTIDSNQEIGDQAESIWTICLKCEMNLEAFQEPISKAWEEDLVIPVLYFPQLMGLAFDLPEKELKLNLNLALTDSFKEMLKS